MVIESTLLHDATPEQRLSIEAGFKLDEACHVDFPHTEQVTRLALKIFDELSPLHNCSPVERYWLLMASLLHDTGWVEGAKSHHKASLRIIMDTPILLLDNHERLVIGSIARYHRKAMPNLKHDHYRTLDLYERRTVSILAGILRVADGLDRRHLCVIEDLRLVVEVPRVRIEFISDRPAQIEAESAAHKAKLLEKVLGIRLVFEEVPE